MKYQRRLNVTAMHQNPIQDRPLRAQNVLALTDTSSPVAEDLGRSEPVSEDLIWWLSQEQIGERIMLFAGDGVEEWLEKCDLRRFKEMKMNGQVWYARVRRNGKLDRARWRFENWQLLGYSKDQYALIRWALFKMDGGWDIHDVYGIIDLFWTVHLGQPPLTVDSVRGWWTFSSVMAQKGFQWP
jgi:hypothetical protein